MLKVLLEPVLNFTTTQLGLPDVAWHAALGPAAGYPRVGCELVEARRAAGLLRLRLPWPRRSGRRPRGRAATGEPCVTNGCAREAAAGLRQAMFCKYCRRTGAGKML